MERRPMRWRRSLCSRGVRALVVVLLCVLAALVLAAEAGAAIVTGRRRRPAHGLVPGTSRRSRRSWSAAARSASCGRRTSKARSTRSRCSTNGTLLVATEKNKVYGLDPATRRAAVVQDAHWARRGTRRDIGCGDLTPTIGVTATPVIDPATNIAYMTHKTYASGTSGPGALVHGRDRPRHGRREAGLPGAN